MALRVEQRANSVPELVGRQSLPRLELGGGEGHGGKEAERSGVDQFAPFLFIPGYHDGLRHHAGKHLRAVVVFGELGRMARNRYSQENLVISSRVTASQ